MTLDVLATARSWLAAGETIALATVVESWGSSPVPSGGRMVIASPERFEGSVSGGCVEADVIVAAGDVAATGLPLLLEFGVADETAWRAGLPCGGAIKILIEQLVADRDLTLVDTLLEARAARRGSAYRTSLGDGARQLVAVDGGAIGDGSGRATADAPVRLVDGAVLHVLLPAPRLVVVGATHIAQHLVALAQATGYLTQVVDPRAAFASRACWGGSDPIVAWPADALAEIGLDPESAVVALSHNADIDDEALLTALGAPCRYVGALGSMRNHARRVARLKEKGVAEDAIARIRAPIGLDIGARTPAEIALAIMAEVVLAFRGPRRR